MVLMRTESIQYNTNSSFGEVINKFQDYNIKKNIRTLERKKKKFQNKDSILFNQTCLNVLYMYTNQKL